MTDSLSVENIQKNLTANMAELLQVPPNQLDPSVSFLAQGADSIVLLEAIGRVEKTYGVRISIQQFFEELESIEALSVYLSKNAVAEQPAPAAEVAAAPSPIAVAVSQQALAQPVPPVAVPKIMPAATGTWGSSNMALMHAQIQLVRQTIEQQNTLLAGRPVQVAQAQPLPAIAAVAPAPSAPLSPTKTVPAAAAQVTAISLKHQRSAAQQIEKMSRRSNASVDFGLYFFGDYTAPYQRDKYELLLESAKYADSRGFSSIWLPERHFASFGGLSPNPAVLCATLAAVTDNIHLRAGSVVAPLHHPVRLAEDWALVDSLSHGRTGMAFACGWHQNDFIFAPEKYENRQQNMVESLEQIRGLWRGDKVEFTTVDGAVTSPKLFPQPCQSEPPIWMTVVNNIEMFSKAGRDGHGVLTNLMAQSPEVLETNIAAYRQAWREAQHPGEGYVTLLMHTYLSDDADAAIEKARLPFQQYLSSAVGLFKSLVNGLGKKVDFDAITDSDKDYLLNAAYDDYVKHRALIGSVESSRALVQKMSDIGVQEIGCFIDFGVEASLVSQSLPVLDQLKNEFVYPVESRLSV